MVDRREPREHVSHLVKLYHRGIICPTEMWLALAKALTPATAYGVLDSLSQDVKVLLRAVYLERPPAAYIERPPWAPHDEDLQAGCVQVVLWCESNGPLPETPAEDDGLIRVRVEGGTIRDWRPWEDAGPAFDRAAPVKPRD